jgi:alcohol dehydrogenase (cytochrome c)
MERFSGHSRIFTRARLLAVAVAAGGMMAAMPVSAADQVNQERLLNVDKEPGNWLHHHQNYAAHRFSTLKEINRDNVRT